MGALCALPRNVVRGNVVRGRIHLKGSGATGHGLTRSVRAEAVATLGARSGPVQVDSAVPPVAWLSAVVVVTYASQSET